jgi:hypothetical protein
MKNPKSIRSLFTLPGFVAASHMNPIDPFHQRQVIA